MQGSNNNSMWYSKDGKERVVCHQVLIGIKDVLDGTRRSSRRVVEDCKYVSLICGRRYQQMERLV